MKNETFQMILVAITFLVIGIIMGMLFQQNIIKSTMMDVASNMEGVNIDINLNESKIMEVTQELVDQMIQFMNESIELNKSVGGAE